MIDLDAVLRGLAAERPLFHSEADFQHALAWKLHEAAPDAQMRLEFKPFPDERFYVDIWMRAASGSVAIELKYPTRVLSSTVAGESFLLKSQGAQDLLRYD
ncbi:MAG: hypothetical protein QJR03_02175 [Sphaerobacter sp.]|nr:hypothetical protein [Sphaerobacter sp.]